MEINGIPAHYEYPDWHHEHGQGVGVVLDEPLGVDEIEMGWLDHRSAHAHALKQAAGPALYVRGKVTPAAMAAAHRCLSAGTEGPQHEPSLSIHVTRIPFSHNNHLHRHKYFTEPGKQCFVAWLQRAGKRGPTLITDTEHGEASMAVAFEALEAHFQGKPLPELTPFQRLLFQSRIAELGERLKRGRSFASLAGSLANNAADYQRLALPQNMDANPFVVYRDASLTGLEQEHLQRWEEGDFLVLCQDNSLHACYTPETTQYNDQGLWYYTFGSSPA